MKTNKTENEQPRTEREAILMESMDQIKYTMLSKVLVPEGAKGKKKKGSGQFKTA